MKAESHLHREEERYESITAFGDDDVHVRAITELVHEACVALSHLGCELKFGVHVDAHAGHDF